MGAVMATVDIPGVGPLDKRVVIGIGAGTCGLIAFILWRRRNAAAEGGDEILPADEGDLTNLGEYGGGNAWQYAATPTGDVTGGYTGAEGIPRTNAEWGQMALDAMEGAGYDRTAAATALGAYQAREKLTSAQAIMIRAALGLVGRPPSGDFPVMLLPVTAPKPTPTPVKPKPTTPAKKPTPVKKPVAKPKVTQALVRPGARGAAVRVIQKIVGTKVDGIWGAKTTAAVKAWQKRHGLVADGLVGPKTQAKMGI